MLTLAERLACGDQAAFAELYDACADRLHHYLVVRLRSRADADDALQETFLRLVRARRKLARVENLMAFVFAVARNEAVRLASRRSREERLHAAASAEAMFRDAASDDAQARKATECVAAALDQLCPELREVVELKAYAGLTLREIGEVADLPQGTVATRYRRALEKMREWFARQP